MEPETCDERKPIGLIFSDENLFLKSHLKANGLSGEPVHLKRERPRKKFNAVCCRKLFQEGETGSSTLGYRSYLIRKIMASEEDPAETVQSSPLFTEEQKQYRHLRRALFDVEISPAIKSNAEKVSTPFFVDPTQIWTQYALQKVISFQLTETNHH
eukprot:TRINITY_DN5012_c0_g1_i3.p1 TRINITY_DN5012_c0_g1~~TRINITY_DN5012_c0_g1_i3.p1  ORF type:complete len:156 (+),score=24.68 TRINITY_DN5012_c0_g1_i3:326-793(+)